MQGNTYKKVVIIELRKYVATIRRNSRMNIMTAYHLKSGDNLQVDFKSDELMNRKLFPVLHS